MTGQRGLLNTEQAAQLLGVSPRTLERLRVIGGGPEFVKIGRSVRYEVSVLYRWLKTRRRMSTSDDGGGQRCMNLDCPR